MQKWCSCATVVALMCGASVATASPPMINGSVGGAEGWSLLTEQAAARPFLGGSATTSDQIAETSTFHWWDGLSNQDRFFTSDNRADLINFHVTASATHLYVAVTGPTLMFNNWGDNNSPGDQGDVYIAIDTSGGVAGGELNVANGHSGFGNRKAVDFLGWRPTHILGVQYADNGGGGGGFANLEATGGGGQLRGAAQGVDDSGFLWNAAVNGAAAYDTHNGVAGEIEFAIPWEALGLDGGLAIDRELRFAAFTTQNFFGFDAYDSLPGIGNGIVHEQIGDNPGDPDGPGLLGASDPGSFVGSFPGSNFVGDFSLSPSNFDGVDTIEEYLVWTSPIPAPGAFLLLPLGLAATGRRRR
ncbi:MAG: hypothetical protein ACK4WH_11675 [Phycisphaerales bacterium]